MIRKHHSSLDKKNSKNDLNKKEINKNRIQKNKIKTNQKLKNIKNIVSRNENIQQPKLNKQKAIKSKKLENNQNIQNDRLKILQKNLKQNNQSVSAKDQQKINRKNQQQRILIEVGQYVKRQSQSKSKNTIPYRNNSNKNSKQTINNPIQLQQKGQQNKYQINNQQVQKIDINTKKNLQTQGNKDNKNKKSSNYKSQLNYKRFVDRNIQKIVKAEKEIVKLTKSKEKISYFNTPNISTNTKAKKPRSHLQSNQSFKLNQSILKNSLNQSFQSVYRDQKKYQQKKKQKIIQLRQSQYLKQLEQATFKPESFTSSYKSTNQLLKHNQKNGNFYQRLKKDNQNRNIHQLKQIAQIMEECPFKPRLNLQTRNSKSIVKNIWSSTEKISTLVKNIKRNSIQKLTIMPNKSQNTSLIGAAQIPLVHTNQLSFLLK